MSFLFNFEKYRSKVDDNKRSDAFNNADMEEKIIQFKSLKR